MGGTIRLEMPRRLDRANSRTLPANGLSCVTAAFAADQAADNRDAAIVPAHQAALRIDRAREPAATRNALRLIWSAGRVMLGLLARGPGPWDPRVFAARTGSVALGGSPRPTEARIRAVGCSLELAQAGRVHRPTAVRPCLVQVVALLGVAVLGEQLIDRRRRHCASPRRATSTQPARPTRARPPVRQRGRGLRRAAAMLRLRQRCPPPPCDFPSDGAAHRAPHQAGAPRSRGQHRSPGPLRTAPGNLLAPLWLDRARREGMRPSGDECVSSIACTRQLPRRGATARAS